MCCFFVVGPPAPWASALCAGELATQMSCGKLSAPEKLDFGNKINSTTFIRLPRCVDECGDLLCPCVSPLSSLIIAYHPFSLSPPGGTSWSVGLLAGWLQSWVYCVISDGVDTVQVHHGRSWEFLRVGLCWLRDAPFAFSPFGASGHHALLVLLSPRPPFARAGKESATQAGSALQVGSRDALFSTRASAAGLGAAKGICTKVGFNSRREFGT